MDTIIALIGLTSLLVSAVQAGYNEPEDFCMLEKFEPQCPSGQVIMMTEARYGKLGPGDCSSDAADASCSVDALPFLHAACSGRESCSYQVPERALDSALPCFRSHRPFLRVKYECITVDTSRSQCLGRQPPRSISRPLGTLASSVTRSSGCGSRDVPWRLQVLGGQSATLTLRDFRADRRTRVNEELQEGCEILGFLTDTVSGEKTTICSSTTQTTVLGSYSDSVDIQLIPPADDGEFFVEYEVIGCADLLTPANAWSKRTGDQLTIGCKHRNMTWALVCRENRWDGVVGVCNKSSSADAGGMGDGDAGAIAGGNEIDEPGPAEEAPKDDMDFLILMAIVAGIAVLFVICATIGIYKLIDHHQRKSAKTAQMEMKLKLDNSTARRYTEEPQKFTPLLQDQSPEQEPYQTRVNPYETRTLPKPPETFDNGGLYSGDQAPDLVNPYDIKTLARHPQAREIVHTPRGLAVKNPDGTLSRAPPGVLVRTPDGSAFRTPIYGSGRPAQGTIPEEGERSSRSRSQTPDMDRRPMRTQAVLETQNPGQKQDSDYYEGSKFPGTITAINPNPGVAQNSPRVGMSPSRAAPNIPTVGQNPPGAAPNPPTVGQNPPRVGQNPSRVAPNPPRVPEPPRVPNATNPPNETVERADVHSRPKDDSDSDAESNHIYAIIPAYTD